MSKVRGVRTVAAVLAFFTAYCVSGRLGLILAETQENVTLLWAPTGIAIGVLVSFSVRLWPVVFVAALIVNIGGDMTLGTAALIACGNTLEALSAWYLLVRVARIDVRLARLRDVALFLLFGVTLCTTVSATVGTGALWLSGAVSRELVGTVWLDWWLGDAGGALVVAPLIMVGARGDPPWSALLRRPEVYLVMTLLALCLGAAFSNLFAHAWQRVLLVFAAFPCVVWAGLRTGPRGAILASMISAAVGVVGTLLGGMLLTGTDVHENLLVLWAFLSTLGATAMILSAAVAERNTADAARTLSELEQRRLEAAVRQKQHLEGLGALAGGVAHDFNNLLAIIGLNVEAIRMEMDDPTPDIGELSSEVSHAIARAAALCEQLLTYAGRRTPTLVHVELGELCADLGQMLRKAVPKRIGLDVQSTENLLPIEGDPSQLTQLVMNLVINASEAIGDKSGRVVVRAGDVLGEVPAPRDNHPMLDRARGPFIYVQIEDDGEGMSEEVMNRLFEPFFTTKFTGRGLGMAAVLGIVSSHGAQLNMESELGKGSKITVYFPRSLGTVVSGAEPTLPAERVSPLRVLLADDEEPVRAVVERVLSTEGHSVLAFPSGVGASAAFADDPSRFDIVILDATMPEMGGIEALAAIRMLAPRVPAILMSGYSDEDLEGRAAMTAYLKKPFRLTALDEALREALRLVSSDES